MRTYQRPFSLRTSLLVKLAVVAVIVVLSIAAVRELSLDRLAQAAAASQGVRNRWLASVSDLDDLTHHIADVRVLEGEALVGVDRSGLGVPKEFQHALDSVDQDIEHYQSLQHDSDEKLAFATFLNAWAEHKVSARRIEALAQGADKAELTALFAGASDSSFASASDTLRSLTMVAQARAQTAGRVAADTIVQARGFISDLILATLLLFASLAVYVWRSFSRPLLVLAAGMQRLATHDTSFAVPYDGRRDEIGEMARSLMVFRTNIIELLESRKELGRQAEMLARLLEKERALATEQRNFITTMSHEFRTPLMLIDGNAQRLVASKDPATPAQIKDRTHRIRAAVFQMTSLVISLTGAIETHRSVPSRMRLDLAKLLRDLVGYYRVVGDHGAIEEHLGDLPQEISGDPQLLHYAFSNLLSNAFKYSPENSSVTFTASARDGFVEIAVADRGIGIPRDEIDRVREKYYRCSNVDSVPGTGMGLHLVDRIARQHGGCLTIDSELGEGTCATIRLPIEGDGAAMEAQL